MLDFVWPLKKDQQAFQTAVGTTFVNEMSSFRCYSHILLSLLRLANCISSTIKTINRGVKIPFYDSGTNLASKTSNFKTFQIMIRPQLMDTLGNGCSSRICWLYLHLQAFHGIRTNLPKILSPTFSSSTCRRHRPINRKSWRLEILNLQQQLSPQWKSHSKLENTSRFIRPWDQLQSRLFYINVRISRKGISSSTRR